MAQKVTILLVDDLDGSAAEETVTFGLDGTTYEIDLSASNASEFRDTLDRFVTAARTANGSRRRRRVGAALEAVPGVTARVPDETPTPSKVRAWAKANGIHVGDKGRVAKAVVAQYQQAMRSPEVA